MNLYDGVIKKVEESIASCDKINLEKETSWPEKEEKVYIFKEEATLELGASNQKSTYLIAYTSNKDLVNKDEIILIGKDLKDLKGDVPFARITFVKVKELKEDLSDQQFYRIVRNIEYQRYHVNPDGYMIRVNTNQIREGARVGKKAINAGISFSDIGKIFEKAYKKDPNVLYVKQVFITDPNFNYEELSKIARLNEGITVTLDHIMKNFKMDCNTCGFKDICDEIEGMRDIHKKEEYKM